MVVKNICRIYIDDCEEKSIAAGCQLPHSICVEGYEGINNNGYNKVGKTFLCPKYQSTQWIERFKTLEFTTNTEDYLYSPKTYNERWDNQTKALWLRSVGISPTRISEKLDVKIDTLKRRWLIKITSYYKLRPMVECDWSNIGYVDLSKNRHILFGGLAVDQGKNYTGLPSHGERPDVATYQKQNIEQLIMDTQLNIMRKRCKDDNSAEDR